MHTAEAHRNDDVSMIPCSSFSVTFQAIFFLKRRSPSGCPYSDLVLAGSWTLVLRNLQGRSDFSAQALKSIQDGGMKVWDLKAPPTSCSLSNVLKDIR